MPDFLELFSPFGYLPNYPLEDIEISKNILLIIISLVFILIGMKGYRNRDLK